MVAVLVPVWILGGTFLAVIVLNSMFNAGTSEMSKRAARLDTVRPPM